MVLTGNIEGWVMRDWSEYYQCVGDTPNESTRRVVRKHVQWFENALDLGAGNMRDARFLLDAGFNLVIAVDADEGVKRFTVPGIEFVHQRVETYVPDMFFFDLIVANHSLFFVKKRSVEQVIVNACKGLRDGGIFAFDLLAPRDEWLKTKGADVSGFTKDELLGLIERTECDRVGLYEDERDGTVANGKPKHWHTWNVVLRRV